MRNRAKLSIYPHCFFYLFFLWAIARKFIYATFVPRNLTTRQINKYVCSNCCCVQRRVYLHVIHSIILRKQMAVHRHPYRWEEPNAFLLAIYLSLSLYLRPANHHYQIDWKKHTILVIFSAKLVLSHISTKYIDGAFEKFSVFLLLSDFCFRASQFYFERQYKKLTI